MSKPVWPQFDPRDNEGVQKYKLRLLVDELSRWVDQVEAGGIGGGGGGGGGSGDAIDIVYDNTTSGLTATNVQDAIDELSAALDALELVVASLTASDIGFVDTVAQLGATNVQQAIDALATADYGFPPQLAWAGIR